MVLLKWRRCFYLTGSHERKDSLKGIEDDNNSKLLWLITLLLSVTHGHCHMMIKVGLLVGAEGIVAAAVTEQDVYYKFILWHRV